MAENKTLKRKNLQFEITQADLEQVYRLWTQTEIPVLPRLGILG